MRVLFLPHYAEPLKALLPFVEAVRDRGHEAVVRPVQRGRVREDDLRTERVLSEHGLSARQVETPRERFSWIGGKVRSLLSALRWPARIRDALRNRDVWVRARRLLDDVAPDVIVVASDTMELTGRIVIAGERRGLPSVCYQWTIANASVRHTREMAQRHPEEHESEEEGGRARPDLPVLGWINRNLDRVVEKVLNLYERRAGLDAEFRTEVYGDGPATRFAVLGPGCLETYRKMGIEPARMEVVGHPVYESLYRRAEEGKAGEDPDFRRRIGLPTRTPLFVWCTNDQRTYYYSRYSYEEMLASWCRIRDLILGASDEWHLVLKPHPKEDPRDYGPVVEGHERVSLVEECDVWKLIEQGEAFLTRFSSTAVSALALGKPTVTHNVPEVPGGTLFGDIGGTFHAHSYEELEEILERIGRRGALEEELRSKREEFFGHYVEIGDRPSEERFVDLLESLVEDGTSDEREP